MTLTLRTPGELLLAYLVAAGVADVGHAVARALGWSNLIAPWPWQIDVGVELAWLSICLGLFWWQRRRNDRRLAGVRP